MKKDEKKKKKKKKMMMMIIRREMIKVRGARWMSSGERGDLELAVDAVGGHDGVTRCGPHVVPVRCEASWRVDPGGRPRHQRTPNSWLFPDFDYYLAIYYRRFGIGLAWLGLAWLYFLRCGSEFPSATAGFKLNVWTESIIFSFSAGCFFFSLGK